MKLHIKKLAFVGLIAATAASCTDNYEELPVDQFTLDYVFSKTDSAGVQAKQFLNNIYSTLPEGLNRIDGDMLDAASDDAISLYIDSDPEIARLQSGRYTPSNMVKSDELWGTCYANIRKCNIFINNIDVVPFNTTYILTTKDENDKDVDMAQPMNRTLKAEARFLRAFNYFMLVERYGGVPLVGDKVFGINDDLEIPRNTFADCINYIVSELDDVQKDLRTLPYKDATSYAHVPGRQACIALKSRVLLYAASPLFNGKTLEAGNPYVGYTDYDVNRWKLAADEARVLIETYGRTGTKTSPNTKYFSLQSALVNSFIEDFGSSNRELIFYRNNFNGHDAEKKNGPLGFTGNRLGNGRTNPTQNLVDAFPMLDGKMPGESTKYPYDPQKPYQNRDPRLDYTVLHNGSQWLNTILATQAGGANNPASSGRYSLTSYFMGKFMADCKAKEEYADHKQMWVYLRYAEVLLNFAEATNEVEGPTSEVYDAIIHIRKRAGIEAGSDKKYGLKADMTQDEMRKVIHNERRIEMAFEEHRYFDIRRWREAENIFAQPLKGMSIIKGGSTTLYSVVDVLKVNWTNQMYLYPIPYTEVNKNKNMVQNPNWK